MTLNRASRGWIRFRVVVQVLAALAVLAVVNFAGFEYFWRGDFSRAQKFQLAQQTQQVLAELDKPLAVTVFASRSGISPVAAVYGDVRGLLDEMVYAGRKRVVVRYVNPVRDLTTAREAQAKYGVGEDALLVEYNGAVRVVPMAEMGIFDFTPVANGGEPRLVAFNGEAVLTAAVLALMNPEKKSVYFLQGHGEAPVQEPSSIVQLTSAIRMQNALVQGLSLADNDSMPSDVASLFIVGAQSDLSPREIEILRTYVAGGGGLCVLLDPNAPTPQLAGLLGEYGIVPRNDRVLRTLNMGFATGILREVTCGFVANNPITRRLAEAGLQLFLPGATQSLDIRTVEGVAVVALVQPTEMFWGEVDYITDAKQGVRYDDGVDMGQPIFVAAAAQGTSTAQATSIAQDKTTAVAEPSSATAAVESKLGSGKVVVVGSCQFALDAAITPPGLDLLASVSHGLLARQQFSGIVPKMKKYQHLNLTAGEMGTISTVALFIVPAVVGLVGIFFTIRRRK